MPLNLLTKFDSYCYFLKPMFALTEENNWCIKHKQTFYLKELRSCICLIVCVWSLFRSVLVYIAFNLSLYFLLILLENYNQ